MPRSEAMRISAKQMIVLALASFALAALFAAGLHGEGGGRREGALSGNLMRLIDNCSGGSCKVSLVAATDFEWDRVAVFEVGTTPAQLSEALGAEYTGETDLTSGVVFSKAGAVVREETSVIDPERPAKLRYNVEGATHAKAYPRAEASFDASKKIVDGVAYYTLNVR